MAQNPFNVVVLPADTISDPATGAVTPAWYQFFLRLVTRTGGALGVDTSALQTQVTQETVDRQASDAALGSQITSVANTSAAAAASLNASLAAETNARINADARLLPKSGGTAFTIGFQGAAPITQPTVTGSRGGNAALASLLTALADYGLVVDSSTP